MWSIYIPEDTFDLMSRCSKAEYHGDRPEKCDYQQAQCEYNGEGRVPCEVRRKGHASWRPMREKPSFKIKNMERDGEDYTFGPSWTTEKMTLNNNAQNTYPAAQVDAYATFRDLGNVAPQARLSTLSLYRGETLLRSDTYTMVETIDDKAFMKKHFGPDYALWEIEYAKAEFERSGGALKDINETLPPSFQVQNIVQYFTAEVLTNHYDGACLRNHFYGPNNHFIALSGGNYTTIPHGLDQVFQCLRQWQAPTALGRLTCAPMKECLAEPTCERRFQAFYANATEHHEEPGPCSPAAFEAGYLLFLLIPLMAVLFCAYRKRKR